MAIEMTTLGSNVIETMKSVLAHTKHPVALHEPNFSGNEWKYVKECIDTGWVSSVGSFVDRFEAQLAEFTDSPYAVAVVNGTAALQVCIQLAGVQSGDEVLLPALTFIATANAVSYGGAIPHFVDSSEVTLGLDPHKLRLYLAEISEIKDGVCFNRKTGRRIRAVVAMHTFGHPVDLDPLIDLCNQFKLELIEDAAESLGSYYKNRHTGTFGSLSALSFNGNKIITTGGGGAILTKDRSLAKVAKHLTTTARVAHQWSFSHDMIGFNYRLPNINAALGCAQIERLPEFIAKKRTLAENYKNAFSSIQGVQVFTEPSFAKSNYWLNALLLDRSFMHERDQILEESNRAGIAARPVWTLMHHLAMYRSCPRMDDLEVAEDIERRLINIPSSAILGKQHA